MIAMFLTLKLLEAVRDYWRWKKPRVYLFPSKLSAPRCGSVQYFV